MALKNVAVYPADNITFWFSFPNSTNWDSAIQTPENLTANFSLEKKNFVDTKDISVKFLVNRNTSRGVLYNFSVFANLTYNGSTKNFSNTIQINVTNVEEVYDSLIIIPSSRGGNSNNNNVPASKPSVGRGRQEGVSAGLGGGATLSYNLTSSFEKNIDIFRGSNKTITINITNPYKNKYFSDINLIISGYYQNHLTFEPKFISKLDFNETKSINISFDAPSYLGYSKNNILLLFNYLVVSTGLNKTSGDNYSNGAYFTLIVNEVSREESIKCFEQSINIINNASLKGFDLKLLNGKFEEQKSAVFSLDFTKANNLCEEIKSDFENIWGYSEKLNALEIDINYSISQGYSLNEVSRLLNITKESFSNGIYSSLDGEIKTIESAYFLQINLEDANLYKRFKKFIVNNILWIILSVIIFSSVSYLMYVRIYHKFIKNKINDLKNEKKLVDLNIIELQKKYFSDKSVSPDYFSLHLGKNQDRLTKINEEILHLNSVSFKFEKNAKTLDALKDKERNIIAAMADLQKRYYIEKSIDKRNYEKSFSAYNDSLMKTKKSNLILRRKEQKSLSAGNLLNKDPNANKA